MFPIKSLIDKSHGETEKETYRRASNVYLLYKKASCLKLFES